MFSTNYKKNDVHLYIKSDSSEFIFSYWYKEIWELIDAFKSAPVGSDKIWQKKKWRETKKSYDENILGIGQAVSIIQIPSIFFVLFSCLLTVFFSIYLVMEKSAF